MRHVLTLAALLVASSASAQTLTQSGPWKGGHVPAYYPGGGTSVPLMIDGGAAGGTGATTQGVTEMLMILPTSPTGPSGSNWCDYDANPSTATAGYHYLCFSPNSSGSGQIIFGSAGGAATIPLNFNVNGSIFSVGGGGATLAFPATVTGGVSGGVPYFSNSGTLSASAVLTGGSLVVGGGAGGAPATTATGTGVVSALAVNVGSSGAFVVNGGALGTPSSGTLTNATGLPIAGLTGLGTGVATALAVNVGSSGSFDKQNGAITTGHCLSWGPGATDSGVGCSGGLTVGSTTIGGGTTGNIEFNNAGVLGELATTGSGNVVRATGPTLSAPVLGTPASATLTNAIGLPITTGVTGLGTNVATALGASTNGTGGMATLNGSPTAGNCLQWSSSGIQGTTLPCSGLTVGTTTTSGGAAGQIMYDTGTVLQENAGLKFVSPSLQVAGALISTGTHPTATGAGGTCAGAVSASSGAVVGIITLTGACAATNTIALSSLPTAPTGHVCNATNRTTPATLVNETSTTVTGVTFTVSGTTSGSTDVIQFHCQAY